MIPQNDTGLMVKMATDPAEVAVWAKTSYANLQRHSGTGRYRCHAKVGGRLIRKVFKTRSLAVAKAHLDALLAEERAKRMITAPEVDGFRMKQVADAWLARIDADPDLKPRAKDYRRETWATVLKVWPELATLRPQRVSVAECKDFAARLRQKYSPSRFNGCVESLRAVFNLAIERGLATTNPALFIDRLGYRRKAKALPNPVTFRKLLRRMAQQPRRRRAAWVVRFLAYSGARPAAAALVRPADVDLERNELRLPPIKHQHAMLVVPLGKELRAVCEELLAAHPGGDLPLLPIKSPRQSLRLAARELGLKLTPYDLRHLFTTHLLENGIAPALVAALRGDKDGGAMLLKTYFHARDNKLREVIKSVKW